MPSVRKKIALLRRFAPLFSQWEWDFLEDIYDGIDGTPDFLNDEAIKEYLYDNQIQKVKEIWKTYSPHIPQIAEK